MTQPQEVDVEFKTGVEALQYYNLNKVSASNIWCYASLNEVRDNFKRMQLLSDDIKFIKGDVCLTLKESENLPTKIAMLRLDTDWYQSTKIELQVLFPLLAHSGILVVDDYGWWKGSKIATDEYFKNTPVFMSYVDQGARLIVKNNL